MPSIRSIIQKGHLQLRPFRVWSLSDDVCDHVAAPGVVEARSPSMSQVAADNADTRHHDDDLLHH